jgi:hypothetical protein
MGKKTGISWTDATCSAVKTSLLEIECVEQSLVQIDLRGKLVEPFVEWLVLLSTIAALTSQDDTRVPLLLALPAAVRFASYEPALAGVDFGTFLCPHWELRGGCWRDGKRICGDGCRCGCHQSQLDWVIVGGESGNGARLFNVEWARSAVAQCRQAGVACFVKQLGSRPCIPATEWCSPNHDWPKLAAAKQDAALRELGLVHIALADEKGGDMAEWPAELRIRELPL